VEGVRLSGHADYNELVQFVKSVRGLKRVFLMHGEKTDLKDALEKDYEVVVPRVLETYSI
jgi:Cft2 family RNA processing exonuclease